MSGVNRPELLSPAGSMESLKAAVNGGCDAVYLGKGTARFDGYHSRRQ